MKARITTIICMLLLIVATVSHAIVFEGEPLDVLVSDSSNGSVVIIVSKTNIFASTTDAAIYCYNLYEHSAESDNPTSNSIHLYIHANISNEAIETICTHFVDHYVYPIEVVIIRENKAIKYQYSPGFLRK